MITGRIVWLDVMKGIAIFMVVIGHIMNNMHLMESPINKWIHLFNMPLFLFLSGFLAFKTSKKSFWENIKKKTKTLCVPFLTCGILYSVAFGKVDEFIFDLHHAGYWFLLSLFTCWIVFLPLHKIIVRYCHNINIIVEFVILLIPFFVGNVVMDNISKEWQNTLCLPLTFAQYRFFILGYIVGKIKFRGCEMSIFNKVVGILKGKILAIAYALFFIISTMVMVELPILANIPMTIIQVLLTFGIFGVLYKVDKYMNNRILTLLSYLGVNSLVIYTMHFFFVYQFPLNGSEFSSGWQFLIAFGLSSIVILMTLLVAAPISKDKFLSIVFLGQKNR